MPGGSVLVAATAGEDQCRACKRVGAVRQKKWQASGLGACLLSGAHRAAGWGAACEQRPVPGGGMASRSSGGTRLATSGRASVCRWSVCVCVHIPWVCLSYGGLILRESCCLLGCIGLRCWCTCVFSFVAQPLSAPFFVAAATPVQQSLCASFCSRCSPPLVGHQRHLSCCVDIVV